MSAPALALCASCGTHRGASEMQDALDLFWRVIPGKVVCRDFEACYQAMLAKPLP